MAIVRLITCNSSIEANTVKALLNNEGIECFLTNENFTTLLPIYNGILGAGVQVMIDEKDNEKALEIINQQGIEKIIICPNCNSKDVVFGLGEKKLQKILVVFISTLFFIPFNNIRNTYYCRNCKSEFLRNNAR